ncbi:hypothetical protein D3C83_267020 [compost metagenome]
MVGTEVLNQLAYGPVLEEQRLGQRSKRLFQFVDQLHRKNGVDSVFTQGRLRVDLVRR